MSISFKRNTNEVIIDPAKGLISAFTSSFILLTLSPSRYPIHVTVLSLSVCIHIFPELDIPYLNARSSMDFSVTTKSLSVSFFSRTYTSRSCSLSSPLTRTVWRWFADNLDHLSRNPKVHASVRPWIPSTLFDGSSVTSMDSQCNRDRDSVVELLNQHFIRCRSFSRGSRPRYFVNQTWPVLEFSA